MAKLLRITDRLLLSLAFLGEVFDEVRLMGGFIPSAYQEMYGFVPSKYKRSNFYATVSRMVKTDLIERVLESGQPKLRLTSVGAKKVVRDFPLLPLQRKPWDSKWRVVIFDIEEKRRRARDNLRIKLRELGFGMYQRSVWVSPHPLEDDVREFLASNGLSDEVSVFISEKSFVGETPSFIEKVWRISDLNQEYEELVVELEESKKKGRIEQGLRARFVDLLMSDPFLPKKLLPKPWWGEIAWRIIKRG